MPVTPLVSNGGETSTRSAPTKSRPPSSRIRRWASSVVRPPGSGVLFPARRRDRACRYRRRNTRGPHPRSVAPPRPPTAIPWPALHRPVHCPSWGCGTKIRNLGRPAGPLGPGRSLGLYRRGLEAGRFIGCRVQWPGNRRGVIRDLVRRSQDFAGDRVPSPSRPLKRRRRDSPIASPAFTVVTI